MAEAQYRPGGAAEAAYLRGYCEGKAAARAALARRLRGEADERASLGGIGGAAARHLLEIAHELEVQEVGRG